MFEVGTEVFVVDASQPHFGQGGVVANPGRLVHLVRVQMDATGQNEYFRPDQLEKSKAMG